jgi:hypothetical protein
MLYENTGIKTNSFIEVSYLNNKIIKYDKLILFPFQYHKNQFKTLMIFDKRSMYLNKFHILDWREEINNNREQYNTSGCYSDKMLKVSPIILRAVR